MGMNISNIQDARYWYTDKSFGHYSFLIISMVKGGMTPKLVGIHNWRQWVTIVWLMKMNQPEHKVWSRKMYMLVIWNIHKNRSKSHQKKTFVYCHVFIYLCTIKLVCRCPSWKSHRIKLVKVLKFLVSALFCSKQTSILAMSRAWVSICFLLTSMCFVNMVDWIFSSWLTYNQMHSFLPCHKSCVIMLGR